MFESWPGLSRSRLLRLGTVAAVSAALTVTAAAGAPQSMAATPTPATVKAATATAAVTPPLDNGLALTPPMGWNSWNSLGTNVTEQNVVDTINFMSANGMVAAGYNTVTIDDGWSLLHRSGQTTDIVKNQYGAMQLYDANGNPVSGLDGTGNDPTSGDLIPNPANFPNQVVNGQTVNGIQYLAWYAHSKGMKFGLYTTDTYVTCQGHPGSLGHETTDANDFVSWGVDYVKLDNCPYGPSIVGPDGHNYGMQGEGRELTESIYARVQTFQKALDAASAAQGKPKIVLSVSAQPAHTGVPYMESPTDPALSDSVVQAAGTSQYDAPGYAPTGVWCGQVANLCRIGGDRDSEISGVMYDGQLQTALQYAANVRPGSWNDMDMMFTGWQDVDGDYGVTDTCTCHAPFTDTESQTEMSVLSMMASPLISGADFRTAAESVHTSDGYTWSTGINADSLAIYENKDVIAVDQDALGEPATLVGSAPNSPTAPVVLKRPLSNGDTAVLLLNQDPNNTQTISASLSSLGLTGNVYDYENLWTKGTGTVSGTISASVPPSGVAMFRISNPPATVTPSFVGDGHYHTIADGSSTGNVLEVAGECAAPAGGGADINTWWTTHTSEQWMFVPNGDGTERIQDNCWTGTQENGSLTQTVGSGGPVQVSNTFDPTNVYQKWVVTENSATGAITITNEGTGDVLDTSGSATGSTVEVNSPTTSPTQDWFALN